MWRRALAAVVTLLLTAILFSQPAAAQTYNPVWHAEYFNNSSLSGQPTVTRDDANIAFNWGVNAPLSGINADNFSVRWATDVSLSPGTYRFYAQADDHIRIYFNYVTWAPVIDTFASGQVNTLVTGDVNVTTPGTYHIQVDYQELTDQALAFVSFANLAGGATGPSFQPPQNPINVPTGAWTAQYFSNPTLTGDPVAILTEASPSHQWGNGQPLANVPADNFSVRWTSTQNLAPGNYTISVSADDGVRVWVNGTLVIDQWHGASGQTYTTGFNVGGGQTFFQIEYYEATANAFLDFALTQAGVIQPTPGVPSSTGASATVTAYKLNVRATPDPIYGQIITRINRLEVYPIVGKNADGSWYLLSINGVNGWVSGSFINVANGGSVPVVGSNGQPATVPTTVPAQGATGNQVSSPTYNVVIRSGPGTQFSRIGLLPVGGVANVVGRNSTNTWWQINFNGLVGWVSAQYAIISSSANIGAIPITG
ncbi:MAG TPA: PA14 domain-containing protein [Phototrophicaceae bacterium]|nr:PA14 domain-containing protein [Phototrophicaceae bacterium]